MRVNAFLGGGALPAAARGTATTQLMHVADIWGTLAELVGQPIADPAASAVGLPPLDTVSFWGSLVLKSPGAKPRAGLLVNNVYWVRHLGTQSQHTSSCKRPGLGC